MNLKLLLAVSIVPIAACTTAPPFIPESKLMLSCPKDSLNGKKVPILIIAKGESSDPLRRVALTIESNPVSHREALTALIQGPYPVSVIKTNVRLAGEGNARLRANGTFESGQ